MSEEEIKQAMEYCYESKPALCSDCPLSETCRKLDADMLGEIFTDMVKGENEDNDI